MTDPRDHAPVKRPARRYRMAVLLGGLLVGIAVTAFVLTAVLVSIFERRQEARMPFVRVVEVDEITTDPEPWGKNWPHQFDDYTRSAGDGYYGGSSAMPESKLERDPWLRRLYAGYAFSLDYREARGHAYMLYDQTVTERVTKRPQAGACLHCHASTTVLYRKAGLEAMGKPAGSEALAAAFDMPAVIRGFEELSPRPYHDVLERLKAMPDGTPGDDAPSPEAGRENGTVAEAPVEIAGAHPVSCIDCHEPASMAVRITRPGFVLGIAELAASDAPVPHLPSIGRWRRGDRHRRYDPNLDASRQEMRSFVCAQCHVEYYCASRMTLTFPWGRGLEAGDIEAFWEETTFSDGSDFHDYEHGETGARLFKAQHPEFEMWSQGVHARSGVACADCHMPYERKGAMKVSSHDVRSPMESLNRSCQTCHSDDERLLREKVGAIQDRTEAMRQRAAAAMTDMLDAIMEARAAGMAGDDLAEAHRLQRKSMWRLDYVSSENSKGFHADQEAVRLLGESIDYSRRAQAAALRWRAPEAPDGDLPIKPIQGVTPTGHGPASPREQRPSRTPASSGTD